ncbi:MAG: squalene--hopene cyclase, partial [Acidiferrobacterales bacterium]
MLRSFAWWIVLGLSGRGWFSRANRSVNVQMLDRGPEPTLPKRSDWQLKQRSDGQRAPTARIEDARLRKALATAHDALLFLQHEDGYWCFELEADCTVPAEYILMMHFMDEIDEGLQGKIAVYLRDRQHDHGGWPLYTGGNFDLSCSVKAYYALKLAGDSAGAPHMVRARDAILAHGGAARSNVFTRITLALFAQIPWRGVPFIPVEIILLPRWFPFHLSKVSYWSRTVLVPLLILCSVKARAKNPSGVGIRELFSVPPEEERHYFPIRSPLNRVFLILDHIGRLIEPLVPRWIRRHAIKRAESWFIERLNGSDGLGAIFPAMVNAHEALAQLGYTADHPHRVMTKEALRKLLVVNEHSAYCQPCVSPVWDTALACLVLHELNGGEPTPQTLRALDWLELRQLLELRGDWSQARPNVRPGGWPFQFGNDHYPDLDDTAVVAWAMHQAGDERYRASIQRAAEWICGMQSRNGGFASFDADNTCYYLNEIPFADHGALLDPPTADVSARCVTLLAQLDQAEYQDTLALSLEFLRREQERDGSWFGRWGTNYIYGAWSVLAALEQAREPKMQPYIRRAAEWLKWVQRPDGGWGESNDSYTDSRQAGQSSTSTAFQTAWAML